MSEVFILKSGIFKIVIKTRLGQDVNQSDLFINSPSSWPRGVFVVDDQENIINRVPAYERLVTGKKRSYPHEVTIL